MSLIKIHNGTAQGDLHLCESCSMSTVYKEGSEINYFCTVLERHIQKSVSSCTSYNLRQESMNYGMYKNRGLLLDFSPTTDELKVENSRFRLIPRWQWHPDAVKPEEIDDEET